MGGLLNLFREAGALEREKWALAKSAPDGAERPPSVFGFAGHDLPVHLLLQVTGRAGKVIWQGDENSDLASHQL